MTSESRANDIVARIEKGLLDGRDVADILRMCVTLGGVVGAQELQTWANDELRGFRDDAEVPEYRRVFAVLKISAIVGNLHVEGQSIAHYELPKEAQDLIDESVALREPIAQLAEQAKPSGGSDRSIKLQPNAAAYVCRLIDKASGNPFQHSTALYYEVPRSAFVAVVDQVKTVATDFIANLRVSLPDQNSEPSAAVTDSALALAITGDHATVSVVTATATRDVVASAAGTGTDPASIHLTRVQLGWTIVGAVATIAVAVVGWLL